MKKLNVPSPVASVFTRAIASAGLILGLLTLTVADASDRAVVPGGIYQWKPPEGATQIRFNNRPLMRLEERVLVGVPLRQALGQAELEYQLNGEPRTHTFSVVDKAYTEQHITLQNREMVNPNPEQLARIRGESSRQRQLYLQFSDTQLPNQGFIQPLQGRISSLFGHRRFFNGQARNPHSGLDIAAPTGTPIKAPAAAKVTLVDDLYYNGKTVFLDHGQGLVTMYCHLSDQLVTAGDAVEQGQIIGLVGATGRVTGPHLHWSVSLNGYRVDPQSMMTLLTPTSVEPQ